MISLVFEIACICAGILLAISHLDQLDGESTFFLKIATKLKPFNSVIGFATLVLGILYLFKAGCLIFSIVGVLCGLLLLPQQLSKVPGIGDSLFKFSDSLQNYKAIAGDIALILGILGLFNMNPFC